MTAQASIPLKWYVPFAQGDSSRVELPVTTSDPTRASQTLGFPPLTMQPPESGGVPPQGEDFNGGLNQVARIAWWVLNGGGWPYDSTFATNSNINGYPNGAKLQSADFRGDWINTTDNNQNNPDTNGTNWVPGFQYGVTALTGLTGGTVTPTPAQAAKGSITLAGALGSALTIVLPSWLKNWTITNNTTGAFVTIVKTAAGSGVTIPQTGQPTRVSGDGANIVQSPENIANATQNANPVALGQLYGGVKGISRNTTSGSLVVPTGVTIMYLSATAGGGGGGFGASTSGNCSGGGGGGGAGQWQLRQPYAVVPGSTINFTVGAGGSSPGGAGTNTVISGTGFNGGVTVTLSPGAGGGNGLQGTTGSASGGLGGSGFPAGSDGQDSSTTGAGMGCGGAGASNPFGGGGGAGRSTFQGTGRSGQPGNGFGAGGGGGGGITGTSTATGGAGTAGQPGIVFFEW